MHKWRFVTLVTAAFAMWRVAFNVGIAMAWIAKHRPRLL
jgi:hypothetical protein